MTLADRTPLGNFLRINTKPTGTGGLGQTSCFSHSAGDLTAAEATGACVDMLGGTVDKSLNALDVGLPCAVGTSVGMAHLYAKSNALIAKFTLCHLMLHLLA